MAAIIHPKWLIEEKAIIFFSEVWFNPPKDPIIIDRIIITIKKLLLILYEINNIGAIFCQVIKIKLLVQFNPSITPGNQKWKGEAPIFKNKVELIINILYIFNDFIWKSIFVKYINMIIEKRSIAEASAWVKKYFKAASVDIKLFILIIKGINDNKLISSPIQALIQEFAEIVVRDPLINVNKNNIFVEFLKIKKKRTIPL